MSCSAQIAQANEKEQSKAKRGMEWKGTEGGSQKEPKAKVPRSGTSMRAGLSGYRFFFVLSPSQKQLLRFLGINLNTGQSWNCTQNKKHPNQNAQKRIVDQVR